MDPGRRASHQSPIGTVTAGVWRAVQTWLKTESPVVVSPLGASPGALGTSSASKSPKVISSSLRHSVRTFCAAM
jgi:hypothetical protein